MDEVQLAVERMIEDDAVSFKEVEDFIKSSTLDSTEKSKLWVLVMIARGDSFDVVVDFIKRLRLPEEEYSALWLVARFHTRSLQTLTS